MRRKTWTMQTITSTISTTMVLVLLGMVILTMLTARVLSDTVKENLIVTVIMEDGTPADTARKVQEQLEVERYVNTIKYVSPEEALQEHIEGMGLDPTDFLGENPFSISLELRMQPDYACNDSLEWIAAELKSREGVTDIIYQKDLVESLNRNLTRISLLLLGIALLLVTVSLVLINNTVRLSVMNHRVIIHTMKLVGAKWSFIRRPFLGKAARMGVVSATLATAILLICIIWATRYDSGVIKFLTIKNFLVTAACLYGIGMSITVLCTYFSVTSSLKKRQYE